MRRHGNYFSNDDEKLKSMECKNYLTAEAAEAGATGVKGFIVCGSVARFCAAGSVGKYSAPFCPQPHNKNVQAIVPKIRGKLFITKL
jgi:hypothetical protein